MGESFGARVKRLREARKWSRRGLADRIGYTPQYVWEQETGRKPPTKRFASACDEKFGENGALVAMVKGDDDMRRRTVLGVGALATMETIRRSLTSAVAGEDADRADLDEWEGVAWEYGHTYLATPASQLLDQLADDFLKIQKLIQLSSENIRPGYCRVASQLAVITAQTLSNLAATEQAKRWWRTARVTADASGDLAAMMMCRGEEVVLGLYDGRPIPVLLQLADQAAQLGGDTPTRGTVGLWAGVAQANATLGRAAEAEDALRRLNELTERLPAETVRAEATIFGWPEYRVRHTESFVYTHLGDTRRAYASQERALALYADRFDLVGRSRVQLHRATCMLLDRDIHNGIAYATSVLTGLPEGYRGDGLVASVLNTVLDAVPKTEAGRSDVRALADLARHS